MGACCSLTLRDENQLILENRRQHSEINDQMRAWKSAESSVLKVLLLGTGDSGKSTIMKQIRRAHIEEIPIMELKPAGKHVKRQICRSIYSILPSHLLHNNSSSFAEEEKEEHPPSPPQEIDQEMRDLLVRLRGQLFHAIEISEQEEPPNFFTPQLADMMKTFWKTDLGQKCFEDRSTVVCMDTLPYFMERLDEISRESYIPPVEHFIRVRIPTIGVRSQTVPFQYNQHRFNHSQSRSHVDAQPIFIDFYDVGGQRNERKKWIHVFDNVTIVLWVVSLSEYDQQLHEARDRNRFDESLSVFEKTVKHPAFASTNFICFLNKKDIFDKKIKHKSFRAGSYHGDRRNGPKIIAYIKSEYREIWKRYGDGKRKLSFYETDATDLKLISNVSTKILVSIIGAEIAHERLV